MWKLHTSVQGLVYQPKTAKVYVFQLHAPKMQLPQNILKQYVVDIS